MRCIKSTGILLPNSQIFDMAEILGVITSILTLCAAFTEAVNRVSELYQAPTEIKTLQVGRTSLYADNCAEGLILV